MLKRGVKKKVSEAERLDQVAYEKRDSEEFNRLKKIIIQTEYVK